MLAKHGIGVRFSIDAPLEKGKDLITGQRFDTDETSAREAQDYAQQMVLAHDTDVFLLLVPKIDVEITNGFTFNDAQYYVTTCVDPRMIGVVLGVFSGHYDTEKQMFGFTYQDLQPHNHDEGIEQ